MATKKKSASSKAAAVEVAGVRVTSPDRPLFGDAPVFTKADLARYVEAVAPAMLVHLGGRPLSAVRHPRGALGPGFYQKHHTAGLPDAVHFVDDAGFGREDRWIVVDDAAGLVALVQMGTIEFHPWGCRAHDIDVPDRVVIDLDPGEGVSFDVVADAAREVRARLNDAGLDAFVKATGGKGVHVCAPLDGHDGWHDVAHFCFAFATAMEQDSPARFTANIRKKARVGRVFVDYLRNMRGSTGIASYSPRARPGAPVSVPLSWDELGALPSWNVLTAVERARQADPWSEWSRAAARLRR